MSLSLFGKKNNDTPKSIFIDRAYINETGKINALIALAKEKPNTLFICWFRETFKKLQAAFEKQTVDVNKILEAKQVNSGMFNNNEVVFVEHHPLHEKELALVDNWPSQKIIVFSSLDEPLFKHFGSEKMLPLIKLLGMKENEAIEHSLVTKSILKGQTKIAALVTLEQTAQSQEDWLEKNLK